MRHLLGVAMATKGLELISGEINGEVANWMMQPAFFPALWVLSCGNPELSAEMQLETNGYTAWYLSAMANGLMPVPGAMPVLVRSEERQGSSTWGGTEGEADTQA